MKNIIALAIALAFMSCKKEIFVEYAQGLDDWTPETHSSTAPLNYDIVFDQSQVNRLDLVFTECNWDDMQDDLADVLSSGGGTQGGPGGGPQEFSDQTPLYFECDMYFNDVQWYHIGVRYKGNSSLNANSGKLPLRLKFSEFEDSYVEITNQTFYGFEELSLGSNYNDSSLMRDKSASDLFRDFGVPAVQTAWYEIWIDTGSGTPEYFGVYTMNEVVFDSFLGDHFGSNSGNCYKPDGDGAAFASNGFTLDDFELKNNKDASKEEITEMFNTLHSSNRLSDPSQWKDDLESVFDVDGFLKYLAVNNTIQNWDTYGNMTHNYYLYHDPADGLLKWIVWDNNEAFTSDNGPRATVSLSMDEVGDDWPLLSFIIGQSEYEEIYKSYLESFISTTFAYSRMDEVYTNQGLLLYDSAKAERFGFTFVGGASVFSSAVSTLESHCQSRINAVNNYL